MEQYISLDKVVKNIYNNRVSFIREKNIELEREYFTKNSFLIPMSELMQGASYEDHFINLKNIIKYGTDSEIRKTFQLLQDYFLFSYGHDMMFKMKLKADMFTSVPIEDFIYPKLSKAVKEKYNDISVMKENPKFNANVEGIDKIVHTYIEMQSLLYLLYCNDFQFPKNWEKMYPDTHEEILKIFNNSKMTTGDFLNALIDFKCQKMSEIFSEISDLELKKTYLEKVETLKEEKHEEIKDFAHVTLPITFFLNNSISDFINMEQKAPILENTTSNKTKKILLP